MRLKAKKYSKLEADRYSKVNCLAFEVK